MHITVHSTIVCDNLIFMDQGATTAPVQIFPEGTAYRIESADPEVVTPSESGMEIVGSAAGATTMDVSGTFRFDMTETVPAINDTYHYTTIIHLNVAGMEFTQTTSTNNF